MSQPIPTSSESSEGGLAEGDAGAPSHGMKDTAISLAIAFVFAFVFRGFVVEPFIIPTGSMAPTLVGAHILARSPNSGTTWAIGPWHYADAARTRPASNQEEVFVPDPSTGERLMFDKPRVRAGDRIFVLKYLYAIFEPSRFDVVVFKNPSEPDVNYIKRLIGLPNEQVALVDGDIFTRDARGLSAEALSGASAWSGEGWRIRRKPERQQRVLWQDVFSSARTPLVTEREGRRWYQSPWVGTSDAPTQEPLPPGGARAGAWSIGDSPVYRFDSASPATLAWNEALFPVNDYYPYNQTHTNYASAKFPVSDVRLRAGLRASSEGLECRAVLVARGHRFEAELRAGVVSIRMAAADGAGEPSSAWQTLGSTPFEGFAPGRVVNVEFWHTDQTLEVWIDGERVLRGEYDWSPAERFLYATGRPAEEVFSTAEIEPAADPALYRRPRISWQFRGAPFEMFNVALERDVQYQPTPTHFAEPALATDPRRMPALKEDQYFVCGDNSPASADSRLWGEPDPWIAEIDPDTGVVNRQLLIGKAFFVYWPATHAGRVPVFDAGRVRFIW